MRLYGFHRPWFYVIAVIADVLLHAFVLPFAIGLPLSARVSLGLVAVLRAGRSEVMPSEPRQPSPNAAALRSHGYTEQEVSGTTGEKARPCAEEGMDQLTVASFGMRPPNSSA